MKNKKRALRRHHYYRIKRNRRHYYGNTEQDYKEYNINNSIRINHCPDCSCEMCGNPRRHFKRVTKNEYINYISFIEQCKEIGYRTKI